MFQRTKETFIPVNSFGKWTSISSQKIEQASIMMLDFLLSRRWSVVAKVNVIVVFVIAMEVTKANIAKIVS